MSFLLPKGFWHGIRTALVVFVCYVMLLGVIIFRSPSKVSDSYQKKHRLQRFYGDGDGEDRVCLVDTPLEGLRARLDLILRAQKTLVVAYHAILPGETSQLFLAAILDAAERGVHVRMVLDGFFHGLKGDMEDVLHAFEIHPNIELRLYEPFQLLRPWVFNNRMHDKFMVVDDKLAILGGRNIGDRFFRTTANIPTQDRDVVVYSILGHPSSTSAVRQIANYFEELFNCPYCTPAQKIMGRVNRLRGEAMQEQLQAFLKDRKRHQADLFQPIPWADISYSTRNVTLIHNPIARMSKEPWCWWELAQLINETSEGIFIQSPYIIPTRSMLSYLKQKRLPSQVTLLTNSMAATPNIPAYSGYIRHRKRLVKGGMTIFEYQGPDSIHAKTLIFGKRLSAVGSFNMESRSSYLSTETMLIIDSEPFTEHLTSKLVPYFNRSLEINRRDYTYIHRPGILAGKVSWLKRILIRIVSMIAPLFDYML